MTTFRRLTILILAALVLTAASFGVAYLTLEVLDDLPEAVVMAGWLWTSIIMWVSTFLVMQRLSAWLWARQKIREANRDQEQGNFRVIPNDVDLATYLRELSQQDVSGPSRPGRQSWRDIDGPVGRSRNG